jgi:hypothetical protein
MTKNDREHYEELSKWAFSKDSDGRPRASRFVVVLLNPILMFLFESKVSKNVGVIFGSLMLACFVSFLPVFPPGTTNLMIGLTLLSLVPSVIEVLLDFSLTISQRSVSVWFSLSTQMDWYCVSSEDL